MILRIAKWTGITLFVLISLLLLLIFVLPKTEFGRRLVDRISRPMIEKAIRTSLGSEIEYGPIEGALPGELILTDISLSADGQEWVSADRLALHWMPVDLIRGRITINDVSLSGAHWAHLPPDMPKKEPAAKKEARNDDALFNLPRLRLDRLAIDDFTIHERIFGHRYNLSLKGDVTAKGQRSMLTFCWMPCPAVIWRA